LQDSHENIIELDQIVLVTPRGIQNMKTVEELG